MYSSSGPESVLPYETSTIIEVVKLRWYPRELTHENGRMRRTDELTAARLSLATPEPSLRRLWLVAAAPHDIDADLPG